MTTATTTKKPTKAKAKAKPTKKAATNAKVVAAAVVKPSTAADDKPKTDDATTTAAAPATTSTAVAVVKTKPTAVAKPAKEKKEKKPQPEMVKIEKYVVEHWAKCKQLGEEIEALLAEYNSLKETAKEIREAAAGKSSILRRLNSRGPEHLPLFDEAPKPTAAAPVANAAPKQLDLLAAPTVDADAWRAAPLRESLHKPGKTVLNKALDVLTKKGFDTIGKLEDLRASGGGYRKWQDAAKGIGDEGAGAVTDAVLAWLQIHRDAAVFAAAAPKKADDVKTTAATEAKADAAANGVLVDKKTVSTNGAPVLKSVKVTKSKTKVDADGKPLNVVRVKYGPAPKADAPTSTKSKAKTPSKKKEKPTAAAK